MKRYVCMMLVLLLVFSTTGIVYANAEDEETTSEAADQIDYLVLVNEENKIPDDWEEKLTLGTTTDIDGNEVQLESETLNHYLEMKKYLMDEKNWDIQILPLGAYESVEAMEDAYKKCAEMNDEEYAKELIGTPGYSESNTGLVVDIGFIRKGQKQIDKDFLLTCNLYKKVYAVLADYGFIIRYPEGKEDITGHSFEPWHVRYVGSPEVAKEITDKGITLEEYLAK